MLVYRIMDFFELAQTLRSSKFRVPSAFRFSDPNELIGSLFSSLIDPSLSHRSEEEIQERVRAQEAVREGHFVSCWTKTRDSVAMWELYSKNRTSVQIEADFDEVKRCFTSHYDSASFIEARHKPANHPEVYYYPPIVDDCDYRNLSMVHDDLKQHVLATSKRYSEALVKGDMDEFTKAYEHADDEYAKQSSKALFIKDENYSYENEVRFCLRSVIRTDRPYEECENDPGFVLRDTHLRPTTRQDTADNIFIDLPPKVIRHVYLDGRAPEWLLDTQRELLSGHGFEVSQSSVYSPLHDRNPVSRWWD